MYNTARYSQKLINGKLFPLDVSRYIFWMKRTKFEIWACGFTDFPNSLLLLNAVYVYLSVRFWLFPRIYRRVISPHCRLYSIRRGIRCMATVSVIHNNGKCVYAIRATVETVFLGRKISLVCELALGVHCIRIYIYIQWIRY